MGVFRAIGWTGAVVGSLLMAGLLIAACAEPTTPTSPSPDRTLPVSLTRFRAESVAFLSISGYDQPATFVVRDQAAWQSTWNQLHGPSRPIPTLPRVDFSAEMIAVAALGSQATSGYDLVLTQASETDGTVTIEAATRSPARGCVVLPVVTSPVDLARLPKRDGPIVFRLIPAAASCP